MYHPFLELEFRDTHDFFYKILMVPQKILKIVGVFTAAATAATDRQPLHGELTTSAGASATGLQRRFEPEAKTNQFFKIFGRTPNYISKI